jgi:hypothetical protein
VVKEIDNVKADLSRHDLIDLVIKKTEADYFSGKSIPIKIKGKKKK